MEASITNWGYIVRLVKGEEVISTLTDFVNHEQIKYGILNGIGACTHVNMAYYSVKQQCYMTKSFQEEYEIMSLNGNISWIEQVPKIHLHLIISDDSFNCRGGHLNSAIVTATAEINIITDNKLIKRKLDENSGLYLLNLQS